MADEARAQRSGLVRADAPLALVAEALIGALVFRVLTREPVDADAMGRLADALFAGIERQPAGSPQADRIERPRAQRAQPSAKARQPRDTR